MASGRVVTTTPRPPLPSSAPSKKRGAGLLMTMECVLAIRTGSKPGVDCPKVVAIEQAKAIVKNLVMGSISGVKLITALFWGFHKDNRNLNKSDFFNDEHSPIIDIYL